ncbi:MAG: PAS domain-containing protein [Planctomycetes bacterium]|nr:PAS domain-containing protein [Planctomycetota bacterium]MCB9891908.1 PAS domain-containing protein [Planctomycetota bacterium]
MLPPLASSLPVETSLALFVIGVLLLAWTGVRQRKLSRRERAVIEITKHLPGIIYRSRLRPDGSSHLEFVTSGPELIGWDPRTLTHPRFDAIRLVHEDDRERIRAETEKLITQGTSGHLELRCLRPDGTPVWVRTGMSAVLSPGGATYIVGFAENVDESHRTREELERAKSRMALAMRAARMGIWDWDIVADQVLWSPEVHELLGLPEGAFGGTYAAYLELVHPEDRSLVTSSLHAVLQGNRDTFDHQNRVRHGDGEYRWVHSSGKVLRNASGKAVRMVGAVVDVTARCRAEQELSEQRERLNFVLTGSQDGFWDWDLATGHVTFSDRWATMLGYAPGEIQPVAAAWEDLMHPADRPHVWDALNAHLNGRTKAYEMEHRLRMRNGAYKWILARGVVVRQDEQGQPLRIAGTHVDIDERKRIQEALASNERRLQDAERIGHFGSFELDVFEGTLLVSPGLLAILGNLGSDELATRETFLAFVHPGDRTAVSEALHHPVGSTGAPLAFRLLAQSGAKRHVQMEAEFHEADRILRGSIRDVTAEKLVERQLARYRDHLERMIRKRTMQLEHTQAELLRKERLATLGQLTGMVGHELRNPLGTIRSTFFSMRDLLTERIPDLKQAVDRIDRNIVRCDRIIEELLDYARSPRAEHSLLDLDAWLDEVLDDLELPAHVELVRERGALAPTLVAPERLRRCVVNLVTNALQAMEGTEGKRVLCVRTSAEGEHTVVEFRDSGPGFSETALEHAMEPLFSTRSFGVGLGLPIVEQIAREHGGEVRLQNHPERGAVVTLTLPRPTGRSD